MPFCSNPSLRKEFYLMCFWLWIARAGCIQIGLGDSFWIGNRGSYISVCLILNLRSPPEKTRKEATPVSLGWWLVSVFGGFMLVCIYVCSYVAMYLCIYVCIFESIYLCTIKLQVSVEYFSINLQCKPGNMMSRSRTLISAPQISTASHSPA